MPAISYWLKHFDLPVCPQCAQKMVFVRVQPVFDRMRVSPASMG
jgi:hypothetical protein